VDKITPELFKVRLKECKQKVLLQEGNPEESDVEEEVRIYVYNLKKNIILTIIAILESGIRG